MASPAYRELNVILEVGSSIGINVPMTLRQRRPDGGGAVRRHRAADRGRSFKQTIDEKTLTELPLNGRQMTSLITLSGASVPRQRATTQGNQGFFSSVSPQIAGGQGNQTDYRLDGGDNNDYETNTNLPFPVPRRGGAVHR